MLLERLHSWSAEGSPPPTGVSGWAEIGERLVGAASSEGRPFVLVLDDAHRLDEARARHLEALVGALARAAEQGSTLHLVLVGPEGSLAEVDNERATVPTTHLSIGPLPLRAVAELLPGHTAASKVRAYGVFGGLPSVVGHLDRSVTVGTNVRRLLMSPNGPLADVGSLWLERDVQAPSRYYAVMHTLAAGEADWATVHAGVPDLTRSGQVAPYLKRLVELGLIAARRSIDAPPRSRSTRYAITDPFFAFWFRFVFLRRLARPSGNELGDYYARMIRPRVDDHLESVFPLVCRQHMTFDAIETFGANAREGGSLWGAGYDLPVAGILSSGAAYYGTCRWSGADEGADPLTAIERSMRETRYGFGRERRLRVVFTGRRAPRELRREVARRHDAQLIDVEALVG
ncbi:MAG: ATP-binding protein [Gemmatimonadota bacterium]|nr:ATP-binding protein [Gemmatimonadota bacterium]